MNPAPQVGGPSSIKNPSRSSLSELARVFLKLGTISFGGPAAHIAMMEEEVVRRLKWIDSQEFLDLMSAANLIPGPNSTELAIHIGHRRAGWPGLLVAGACFILPAACLVTLVAWIYVRFGTLPAGVEIMQGIKPVIVVIIVQAMLRLWPKAMRGPQLTALGMVGFLASWMGVHELVVLFASGVLAAVFFGVRNPSTSGRLAMTTSSLALPITAAGASAGAAAVGVPYSLSGLFLFFLKVGSVLFGSGYVLLAFLRADLVTRWGWLSDRQLLDAIAVGQFTPGPLFTTATFVGFLLDGWKGAGVATLGIFLPAFCFVALSAPWIPKMRHSPRFAAFLDGVNVASLGLMAWVTVELGRAALGDWVSWGTAMVAGWVLWKFRVNSAWLVLGGALVGGCRVFWGHA